MCGIFCCISISDHHNCLDYEIMELLQNRGPNSFHNIRVNRLHIAGSVLWQQGKKMCVQPVESEQNILVFNGDIFSDEELGQSDTEWLFEKLSNASNEYEFVNVFHQVKGPFSFVFYDKRKQCIYFARDSLGRNSLLLEKIKNHMHILSTSHIYQDDTLTIELPPLGVFKIDLQNLGSLQVFPWENPNDYCLKQVKDLENLLQIQIFIKRTVDLDWLKEDKECNKFLFSFYDLEYEKNLSATQLFDNFLKVEQLLVALDSFSYHLERSVKQRVAATKNFCTKCSGSDFRCNHSKIAIFFSGGIDCSILAVLADKCVPKSDTIDLINVAFQAANTNDINWDVPDRLTAKSSLINLKKICPLRRWNFIEINVTREQLNFQMQRRIKHLIHPLNTVLDESIGCAFWFAAEASAAANLEKYVSSARVVLVGSGADELFGGYMRHKNAYKHCTGTQDDKLKCVDNELEIDWRRLPARNLARDDRVICDNGRTPRAPFIEENVARFVRALRSDQRCCFLYGDGIGDKLFLRLYGYRLGLTYPAFLKKKAIQFGSKIANKKQNAKDISAALIKIPS